ncbi:MAG: hypothetical protein AAGH79_07115 [Bacteroidota bacterium]
MDNRAINNLLSKLEKESNNEFGLLESTGPDFFSTPSLLELRGQWKERMRLFQVLHRLTISIGASSPAWLVLGAIFGILGLQLPATICLLMFPISFLIFLISTFAIRSYFRGKGHLEMMGRMIENELIRRQDKLARRGH